MIVRVEHLTSKYERKDSLLIPFLPPPPSPAPPMTVLRMLTPSGTKPLR